MCSVPGQARRHCFFRIDTGICLPYMERLRGEPFAREVLPGVCFRWPFGFFQGAAPQNVRNKEALMARITVEDCQERVDNRFLLVQMAIKRVRQYRDGYEALVDSRNKEVVTALREIAGGKVMPEDLSYYTPLTAPVESDPDQ